MEKFKTIQGTKESSWQIMNISEFEQVSGHKVRVTSMGCPTHKLGTLIQTITDTFKGDELVSTTANLYHVPFSKMKPVTDSQNSIQGYILQSETEPS